MKLLLIGLMLLSLTVLAAEAPSDRSPPYQAEFNKCVNAYIKYCQTQKDKAECEKDILNGCATVAGCLNKYNYLKTNDPKEENNMVKGCIDEVLKKSNGSNHTRIDVFNPVVGKFKQYFFK